MSDAPIAFLDSGVGGLPYLELARRHLPGQRFAYVADRAHFPYGEKSAAAVRDAVVDTMDRLWRTDPPKTAVVACNTASVVALEALRSRFPIPFVGVVPAIKPAAERSASKRIGVWATQKTLEDGYVDDLVRRFAADCVVVRVPGRDIVRFVENDLSNASVEKRGACVAETARTFSKAKVDQVVLGCTHFIHLAAELEAALGPGARVVDSREGVCRQLLRVLPEPPRPEAPDTPNRLYVTGPVAENDRYAEFARRFGLVFVGSL
jgi:glutamate racemase